MSEPDQRFKIIVSVLVKFIICIVLKIDLIIHICRHANLKQVRKIIERKKCIFFISVEVMHSIKVGILN